VPCGADVGALVWFLSHFRDDRVIFDWLEKSINVNFPPTPGEFDVLIRRYNLVAEKNHTVVGKCTPNFRKLFRTNVRGNIDTG